MLAAAVSVGHLHPKRAKNYSSQERWKFFVNSQKLYLRLYLLVKMGESGSLARKYDLKSFYDPIVDVVYVTGRSLFVVLLKDGSLVVVPENCQSASEMVREKWPVAVRPQRLWALENDLLVYCEGGNLCKVLLDHSKAQYPAGAITSFLPQSLSLVDQSLAHLSVSKSHVVVVVNVKEGGSVESSKRSKSKTTESVKTVAFLWPIDAASANTNTFWLDGEKMSILNLPVDASSQLLVKVFLYQEGESLSLITTSKDNNNSNITTWMNVDLRGELLFQREIGVDIQEVFDLNDGLWLVDGKGDRKVHGPVVLCEFDRDISLGAVLLVERMADEGPSILYQRSFAMPSHQAQSLLGCLMVSMQSMEQEKTSQTNSVKKSVSGGSQLGQLPANEQEQLNALLQEYLNTVHKEGERGEKARAHIASYGRKRKLVGMELDPRVASSFLDRLRAVEVIDKMDWEVVKALVRSGDVNMGDHAFLFQRALIIYRFDIICEILRFTADVTETHAVAALKRACTLPESFVPKFEIVGCVLWYMEVYRHDRDDGVFISADLPPREQKPGKTTRQLTYHKVFQGILESILLRPAAFTTYLISEAVQSVSPTVAAMVIRILTNLIRGICVPQIAPMPVFFYFGDDQLQRAITWMEGILDAHLTTFALEASRQPAVHKALSATISLVSGAQEALEHTEQLLGTWTHIERVLNRKAGHVQPVEKYYQVESINL
eukprot:scaffold1754_cov180-Ochromonas_danica.AAC.21